MQYIYIQNVNIFQQFISCILEQFWESYSIFFWNSILDHMVPYNHCHMTVFSHLFSPKWTAAESSKLQLLLWIHLQLYVFLLLRMDYVIHTVTMYIVKSCRILPFFSILFYQIRSRSEGVTVFSFRIVFDLLRWLVICQTTANNFTARAVKLFVHVGDFCLCCQTILRQDSTHLVA